MKTAIAPLQSLGQTPSICWRWRTVRQRPHCLVEQGDDVAIDHVTILELLVIELDARDRAAILGHHRVKRLIGEAAHGWERRIDQKEIPATSLIPVWVGSTGAKLGLRRSRG